MVFHADSVKTTQGANALNQYVKINDRIDKILTHDDNGNMLSFNGADYAWDEENRLKTIYYDGSANDHRTEFDYDGLSRRVERREKNSSNVTTLTVSYTYDGLLPIKHVNVGTGTVKQFFTRGLDLSGQSLSGAGGTGGLLALTNVGGGNPGSFYYFYDGSGNVTDIIPADNLALGKAVTADSNEDDKANAVDGDSGTDWTPSGTDQHSLAVNLGAAYSVDAIRVRTAAALAEFTLQYHTGGNWSTLAAETSNTQADKWENFTAVTTDRVRLLSDADTFDLLELEVYGHNTAARYKYDPSGKVVSQTGALADANPYRFGTQEFHAESGLYLYLFREYAPGLARFLSRDKPGEPGATIQWFYEWNFGLRAPAFASSVSFVTPTENSYRSANLFVSFLNDNLNYHDRFGLIPNHGGGAPGGGWPGGGNGGTGGGAPVFPPPPGGGNGGGSGGGGGGGGGGWPGGGGSFCDKLANNIASKRAALDAILSRSTNPPPSERPSWKKTIANGIEKGTDAIGKVNDLAGLKYPGEVSSFIGNGVTAASVAINLAQIRSGLDQGDLSPQLAQGIAGLGQTAANFAGSSLLSHVASNSYIELSSGWVGVSSAAQTLATRGNVTLVVGGLAIAAAQFAGEKWYDYKDKMNAEAGDARSQENIHNAINSLNKMNSEYNNKCK